MKKAYAATLVAIVVVTVSPGLAGHGDAVLGSPGVNQGDSKQYFFKWHATEQPMVLLLGPDAELRALAGTDIDLIAPNAQFDTPTGAMTATGATAKIAAGTNSVAVQADEVRVLPREAASARKQAPGERVFMLRSGGATIAELRLRGAAPVAVQSANSSGDLGYATSTGALLARGGVVLKVTAGTKSVSVRADEIESVPAPK